jgi:hypothetical protein
MSTSKILTPFGARDRSTFGTAEIIIWILAPTSGCQMESSWTAALYVTAAPRTVEAMEDAVIKPFMMARGFGFGLKQELECD